MDLNERNELELDIESFSGLEAMFGLQNVDASESEAEAPAKNVQDQGSPAIKRLERLHELPVQDQRSPAVKRLERFLELPATSATPPRPSRLAFDSPPTLASSPLPPPAPHVSPRPETLPIVTLPRPHNLCRALPCAKLKKGKSAFCDEHRKEWEAALKDAAAQDEEFGDNARVVELQQLSDEQVGNM